METRKAFVMVWALLGSVTATAALYEIGEDEYWYGVRLQNDDKLVVNGGGADEIYAEGLSSIVINSTSVSLGLDMGGIYGIKLNDNSTLSYVNGFSGDIKIYDSATVALSGGSIDHIVSYQNAVFTGQWDAFGKPIYDGHIDMYVKTYSYNSMTQTLSGTWADDTPFNIQLHDQAGYDPAIDNIDLIIVTATNPEPATVMLMGLGAFLIRCKYNTGL